ncbi:TIGR03826 family flagellar region protein [Alkalihalobacillus pseudalcaliphilus]|uniref:TIGR03826 family flagellar region protein n=1 Tax=Alkalihalobacillus pseudalcaliphilus TaxID=79884 RepID=UPI00069F80A1|nr:TIGR03826 family flagellar region protein [Alkalihalobacillus pseudalcaliphilus]
MSNLTNCPICGRLFMKGLRKVCNTCFKKQEEQFEVVRSYMNKKENRMATVQEVHAYTEVPYERIYQFIREGRLLTTNFPNLGYPCESCGDSIHQGRLCESCKDRVIKGVHQHERQKQFEENVRQDLTSKNQTYRSININRYKD